MFMHQNHKKIVYTSVAYGSVWIFTFDVSLDSELVVRHITRERKSGYICRLSDIRKCDSTSLNLNFMIILCRYVFSLLCLVEEYKVAGWSGNVLTFSMKVNLRTCIKMISESTGFHLVRGNNTFLKCC